jgi:hypothetical protein
MRASMMLVPLALLGVVGCNEAPLDPVAIDGLAPRAHLGSPASSCTLAPLPAAAHVIACFTTALQPGVWHGFVMELATAQPPGTDGNFSRTRLNHQYLLASPQGFTRWGPSDPIAPAVLVQSLYAFQTEFNGTSWFDVLRLASASSAPQTVPVVVYWLDAADAAGELTAAVNALLASGVVNGGQANALTRKIDQALALVAKGRTADAQLVLQGFVQQVNDLTNDGVLSPAEAQPLIAWAQYIITGIGGPSPPSGGPFAGTWTGTYTFGPMSGVLQQNGTAVTGTIIDAVDCIWEVTGTASGNSVSLPNWVLQSGASACVGSVSMSGSLDASGNTWTGTGSTTSVSTGGVPVPWTFSLARVSP